MQACMQCCAQVKEVKALIGFFDLDPNRVYDLVLDGFEAALAAGGGGNAAAAAPAGRDAAVFLALARLFSAEARVQLLGFKFQQLAGEKEGTPHALYLVASHMVKVGWWPSVSASYFSHTASETIVCRDTTAVPEDL